VAVRGDRKRLDVAPRVVLVPGVGICAAGSTARDASIALEIYAHTIDVIEDATLVGRYAPVPPLDLFDLEYWPLEQAKLGKVVARPLDGRIALVTGAASGIGRATAAAFLAAGAHVHLVDRDESTLNGARDALAAGAKWRVSASACDVSDEAEVARAFDACVDAFGGVDVVVSNAGTAPQGMLHEEGGTRALASSLAPNLLGHQHVASCATNVFLAQGNGGALLFNASKAAFNPGPGFGPYAVAKAATVALMRQYAIDLGPHGVRSNAINADRIRTGLFGGGVLEARARARGLDPDAYFKANLLGREVTADDVAAAFLHLAIAKATTGAVLTVDGGNAAAFPR
jgi:NAD(P)-dependent dehydrogenase (short-subunit alcohol dehydrogenase family)